MTIILSAQHWNYVMGKGNGKQRLVVLESLVGPMLAWPKKVSSYRIVYVAEIQVTI